MKNAIILLSGGLDSVISLAVIKQIYNDILALTFNYGQKSFQSEKDASEKISKYYNIEHKIINLDWLAEISKSALNTKCSIPKLSDTDLDDIKKTNISAKAVWVPNRNALFANIAACFAETYDYNDIVIGANKEEGQTFKDNTVEFVNAVNNSLKNSVNKEIKLTAPLINMTKTDIVKEGIKLHAPFELIFSCYKSGKKHCGGCESCKRLKRALELNNRKDIISKIF